MSISITPETVEKWGAVGKKIGWFTLIAVSLIAFGMWQFWEMSQRHNALQERYLDSLTGVVEKNTEAFQANAQALRGLESKLD